MPTIHPQCSTGCQKLAKIGEVCKASCELAPFAGNLALVAVPTIPPGCTCEYSINPCPVHGTHYVMDEGEPIGILVPNAPTGTLCSVCNEPQVMSPGGVTCKFGHGGAPASHEAPVLVASVEVSQDEPRKRINVRSKGQRGEREVVKLLQDVVDRVRARYKAEPLVLQRNALQAHLGGCDLHGLEGFAVEVKFVEVESVGQWWRQAVRQAEALTKPNHVAHIPILFYRASRRPWAVKFRAYVQTPRDRDLVELDVETDLQDFLDWFENAYDEVMAEWEQTLG